MVIDKTYIIAEIGINHNGSVETAKKLIETAKSAGCDAVKFQKRSIDLVYTKEELDVPRNSPWGKTNRDQKLGLEFEKKEYDQIDAFCKKIDIDWFASCWDMKSIDFIEQYDPKFHKVASAMVLDKSFLDKLLKLDKPLIISTGMLTDRQFTDLVNRIPNRCFSETNQHCFMHCTSTYPTKPEEMNLSVITTMLARWPTLRVGFSNHYSGIVWAPVAVALGAKMLEFHITLDRTLYGSDQAASIEPDGVRKLVEHVRVVEEMLGDGKKICYDSELPIEKKLRRIRDLL